MKFEFKRIVYALYTPLVLVVILWLIHVFQWNLNANWAHLGIYPRASHGLIGIITGPLIHGDLEHLFSNTVPLLILGWCLFYFYKDLGYLVLPVVWIGTGLITWFIGRESWHIGASGLIYGLSFFLFFSGILRKYIPLMAISLLVAFLYGSIVFNMLPVAELVYHNISWEGHLSGAITGLLCAVIFKNYGPQKPPEPEEDEDNEDNDEDEEDFITTQGAV